MNSRKEFIETLSELTRKDPTIMLIVMDVGFSFIEEFAQEFPNQFLNTGVTEQATMGIAAGMALSGLKPYVYSMVPFVLMRPYEQVRNDIVKHGANVKLIGVRGSEHYKFLGFSHNVSDEDEINLLKSLGIKWSWPDNVKEQMLNDYESLQPRYLRL